MVSKEVQSHHFGPFSLLGWTVIFCFAVWLFVLWIAMRLLPFIKLFFAR